jgi:hypothetical protein
MKVTPCVPILSKNVIFSFYKIGEQECGTGPAWGGWYQWEEGGCGKRVWEGEYRVNTL